MEIRTHLTGKRLDENDLCVNLLERKSPQFKINEEVSS